MPAVVLIILSRLKMEVCGVIQSPPGRRGDVSLWLFASFEGCGVSLAIEGLADVPGAPAKVEMTDVRHQGRMTVFADCDGHAQVLGD